MTTQKDDLVFDIQELRLEIKENAERIDKLCDILKQNNTKLRTLKKMNTNEAVENKLQNKNWKVQVMNANYPMLEVVDENTAKIEGVEYKKVEKEKPQTLLDIVREWCDDDNDPTCEELVDRVERWMSQYECDYVVNADYLQGYNALMNTLKANLK
jgi:hypothetical protein